MKRDAIFASLFSVMIVALIVAACAPAGSANQPSSSAASSSETFTDPFAYCAAVGTIDAPDARFTGDKVPDVIVQGYKKAAGLENSTEPSDQFTKSTIWRCMDQKVYACNFGANLPCDSKADTNKEPTQAMTDFCKANQNADSIPMSVTGHATIFSWHCAGDAPEVLKQMDEADAQGFVKSIWYALSQGS